MVPARLVISPVAPCRSCAANWFRAREPSRQKGAGPRKRGGISPVPFRSPV